MQLLCYNASTFSKWYLSLELPGALARILPNILRGKRHNLMATDGNRLAHIFVWKEGTTPDLQYARQILSVVNPDAARAIEGDNAPISLFSIAPPWPSDLWARAIGDLRGFSAYQANGTDWTDTSRYDLAGWQGNDRRTAEHIFVVTAYRRAATTLAESDFEGEGVGAPSQIMAAGTADTAGTSRPPIAQVPYYPLRPTGPITWPPQSIDTPSQPGQAVQVEQPYPAYGYTYNSLVGVPVGATSGDLVGGAAAHSALIDSYKPFYAGFGLRVTAGLIDFFFMSLFQLTTVAALLSAGKGEQPTDPGGWLAAYGLYACMGLAIFATYHVVQWSVWGQTIGKKLVGIKVVTPDGEVPGWGRSMLRMLGYFFSLSLGGWGVVMIALDLRHQGLHDKMAETFVVPEKATVPAPAGLPGYKASRQAQTQPPKVTGIRESADTEEQTGQLHARETSSALAMANVAGAPPYNEIQIAMGGEALRGSKPVGAEWQSPYTTNPIASASLNPTLGREQTLDTATIPNLDQISTGPLDEGIATQEAIGGTTAPDPQQTPSSTIQARTLFKAGLTQMEAGVSPSLRGYKVEPGPARAASGLFKQALERVPSSVVYRYFYAIALRYSEGFEVAISELRHVLEQDPTHYEARRQVAYGPRWHDAFAYPGWVSPAPIEIGAPLPEAIRALLPPGQQPATRLVLLREGGLKVAAFLSRTPRAAWNTVPNAEMPAYLQLFLSRTPFGPIIALYIVVQDDAQNPYIGETFLNPHDPGAPSEDACQLGQNMLEQIARQDRTYLIFADEDDHLLLSRKLVFDATTQVSTARILYEVQTLPPQVMDQDRFRQAAQWHMDHFSLDQLKG